MKPHHRHVLQLMRDAMRQSGSMNAFDAALVHGNTLLAFKAKGYVEAADDGRMWRLTELGIQETR